MSTFAAQIKAFNQMYGLPVNTAPTLLGIQRLVDFKHALQNELNEIDDVIHNYETLLTAKDGEYTDTERFELLTGLADLLGDLQVYCASEMAKWGLPLDGVLDVIMASNMSKLGADGLPIVDERGKVQKGPNYWKPEPEINRLLRLTSEDPIQTDRMKYTGTKTVYATPMTRGQYNEYRDWKLPEGENPADPGYLIEYLDGGTPNDPRHAGYISWSPKDVFDRAYVPLAANR